MVPVNLGTSAAPPPSPAAPPILLAWQRPDLIHGFAGREGGVSTGPFAALNLSGKVGDERAAVQENWRRMRLVIGADTPVAMLRQVHGSAVRVVSRSEANAGPEGDGMVATEAGLVLAILTADCVPVLMFDGEARVAGVLHAGWRGTLAGIAHAGVRAMEERGAKAERVCAALGPSIGPCCFEVDAKLAGRFAREIPGAARYRRPGRPGKAYVDLGAIVADALTRAGVRREAIVQVRPCTRCANERYFSRRAAGGGTTGLQLSFIGFHPEAALRVTS